ncbi:MAG: acyloxyacyl hydrolase [Clostridium sp.]|nr:acyloxyacyl hydrolase [Clostridium sp.]
MKRLSYAIISLLCACAFASASSLDSIPPGFSRPLSWSVGAEGNPALIPGTCGFIKGDNPESKIIKSGFSGYLRADFSFAPTTKQGMLYHGLYQGVGVGVNTFFSNSLLGTPVSAFVYQGAPIAHLSSRLWLGYEWRFGAAFGWKRHDAEADDNNAAISTSATALLGIGLKLHYDISDRWRLSLGVNGTHYSNGNTSWPNAGLNAIGATIGIAYALNPQPLREETPSWLEEEADRGGWICDIVVYGAWRKRATRAPDFPQMCPGKFGVAGLQFSPLRRLNRWVAVGPSLDLQWDESAGLDPYWMEGTTGEDIKFARPPFGKQISMGASAHAELTTPIFSVNAGLGYDFVCPKGDKRFYQSLTLKAFLTNYLFLNVGYRLGDFKDPQNLMLGLGLRL